MFNLPLCVPMLQCDFEHVQECLLRCTARKNRGGFVAETQMAAQVATHEPLPIPQRTSMRPRDAWPKAPEQIVCFIRYTWLPGKGSQARVLGLVAHHAGTPGPAWRVVT
jgi:hypothetical protein